MASRAEVELPPPGFELSELKDPFARRGLRARQMVILSWSHTVGRGHCDQFVARLYNFDSTHFSDPTIDSPSANEVKHICPITFHHLVRTEACNN